VLRLGKVWPACGQGGGTVVTAIEVSTKDVGYKRVLTGLIRSSGSAHAHSYSSTPQPGMNGGFLQ